MRILRIAGRNLASLADEFSVDFTRQPLSDAGLFAISGPTGAGKSTLLDALCLALYDATPRLRKAGGKTPDAGDAINSHDPRTLLRRGAAEGWAEVDFVGNDGKPYRARWHARRARNKAAGALQPTVMSLVSLPELQSLAHNKSEVLPEIARRIGLSFEQFTRAVLLAQNEFSTFLKAQDDERGTLLETLTGSGIYSDISRRAFERWRSEEATLKALTAGLANQQPMAPEQRADVCAQSEAAEQALHAIGQRHASLEADLRWHQQAERLAAGVQQARDQAQQRQQEIAAAAPRHAALAQLEAAQAARPLDAEVLRLAAESATVQSSITLAEQESGRTTLALEVLSNDLQQAGAQLAAAEAAQQAAAPQLDQAKALDARLAALRSVLAQAMTARDAAAQADAAAGAALDAKAAQQQDLAQQQQAGQDWLAAHEHWATLARDWARWDVLLTQASQQAARAQQQSEDLAALQTVADSLRQQASHAQQGLAGAAERLRLAEVQREQAISALQGADGDALAAQRQGLEQQRSQLAEADKTWQELSQRQQRGQELSARGIELQQARDAAEMLVAEARQANFALIAATEQAERSLKLAEAATGASIEQLRAALEDDTPCPVCGGIDHPYRHDGGPLQDMLLQLRAEVQSCRDKLQHNMRHESAQQAKLQSSIEQLTVIAAEQHIINDAIGQYQPRWQSAIAALPGCPDDGAAAEWLATRQAALLAALRLLDEQEQGYRRAVRARDVAQTACEQARAEHARHQQALAVAQAALAQNDVQQQSLQAQRTDTALQTGALLDELEVALPRDGWQEEWKAAPARFHELRTREARQWQSNRSTSDERAAALAAIAIELQALRTARERTNADCVAAQWNAQQAQAACDAAAGQRQALFDGRPASEVEAGLRAALDATRATLHARQQAAQQAAQQRSRAEEALAHHRQHYAALMQSAQAATARLQDWLASDVAPGVSTLEQLRTLLARPAQDMHDERSALRALEQAFASAQAVLAEREAQHAQHLASAPPADSRPAAELQQALDSIVLERQQAHDHAAALKLQLAQDDACRVAAASLLADIARQQEQERRWAQLNELIGSADGKKFRTYAQQFTLDVLLGYANAHLAALAPRYQLERIDNPAQPSLGLLVRDLHMGDELRSVHSLSGGESFLVSLAMALGLASLSSNRVRVESLFIDEGFGSLDAETLRVAMDALDGLQSMGRKVGVISHVQEMTERIATRIVVQPAANGRSVVSVS